MRQGAVFLALPVIVGLLLAGCGDDDGQSTPSVTMRPPGSAQPSAPAPGAPSRSPGRTAPAGTATPSLQRTESPATAPPATAVAAPVQVFFSKDPDSQNDPAKVFAVQRVSSTLGVARFAVEELIKGPTPAETALGYYSEWQKFQYMGASDCGGENFALSIDTGRATIRFCRSVRLLGTLSDARADQTLKATLLQFPSVDKAVILDKQGHCLFDSSGMDLCK